ncbi:hypothetical protein KC347_g5183 [Hortaea werneckii]|nr:hypothetical protein KC347_g5183 [Hortaea werneckii]
MASSTSMATESSARSTQSSLRTNSTTTRNSESSLPSTSSVLQTNDGAQSSGTPSETGGAQSSGAILTSGSSTTRSSAITTKHNDLVSQHDIFNILQLTVIFGVFELPLIVLRCIDNVSLIYEQLNQQFSQHLILQLALQPVFQLKLVKKRHIIAYKQFNHESKPYTDYLSVCNVEYDSLDSNVPGLGPLAVNSLNACVDLCTNQGTNCTGFTFSKSRRECLLKKIMVPSIDSDPDFDSVVRIAGPGGTSRRSQLIANGDFSASQLAPWTTEGTEGVTFGVSNGAAIANFPAADPDQSSYYAEIRQSFGTPPALGSAYFCTLNAAYVYDTDALCSITIYAINEDGFYIELFDSADYESSIRASYNISGVVTSTRTGLAIRLSCSDAPARSISFDDVGFYTYAAAAGANPICPTPQQLITNGDFSSGGQDWEPEITGIVASYNGGTSGQAEFAFTSQAADERSPIYLAQQTALVEVDQTYAVDAFVNIVVSEATASCDASIVLGFNTPWEVYGSSTASYPISVRGVTTSDFSSRCHCAARAAVPNLRTFLGEQLELQIPYEVTSSPTSRSSMVDTASRLLNWRNAKSIGIRFFWVFGTATFVVDNVVQCTSVTGGSMEPTLSPLDNTTGQKDYVLWNKWEIESKIRRGDIVLFSLPGRPDDRGTKRVIATEGDTVILDPRRRPKHEASGRDLPESTGWDMYMRRVEIPPGHVWVEGDNWRKTRDSNWYGPISKSLIQGKASAVVWPWDRSGSKPWESFKSKTKVIQGQPREERENEWRVLESMGPNKPV